MSTENSPQVWRVECDDSVREVTVTREEDGYIRTEAADRTALAEMFAEMARGERARVEIKVHTVRLVVRAPEKE